MLRFLVIIILGLHLSCDQCYGFAEEALRELCRKLPSTDPSPANNGSSMAPAESATFSCGYCSPGTSRKPYVCSYCYEGTQGSERKAFFGKSSLRTYSQIGIREAFSCQGCKFGLIQKPVICDDCKTKTDHASQESATGCCCHIYFNCFSPLGTDLTLSLCPSVAINDKENFISRKDMYIQQYKYSKVQ